MLPTWLPLLLGVLTAVGPVSTDMYLPAFPQIEHDLGGQAGAAQITLAAWFAGLAVGQITQGTLSDRYGRRGPLLVGTVLYALCSTGCALAPGLVSLSAFRFAAAFGGSASMVIPRAVVRDVADGHEAVRLMSRLMLVMGVTPILAPTLGGLVLSVTGWRVIFWAAAVYGLVCTGLVWRFLPDTLPRDRRVRLGLAGLVSRYRMIGRDRGFLSHALLGGCGLFSMFAYLGGSPGVFIELLHLSPPQYGMVFGANAFGYILASQVNARLVGRFGLARVLTGGTAAFLVSTAAEAAVAWAGLDRFLLTLLPISAMWISLGFLTPNAAVGALSRHAPHAASASALMGTLQFILGAVSGTLIGLLDDGTARPMAGLLLLGAVGAVLAARARPAAALPVDAGLIPVAAHPQDGA